MNRFLVFILALCFHHSSASFDKISPSDRSAIRSGTFPVEVFYVIIGMGGFGDLQKWMLVSKQMHALTMNEFLVKYGRRTNPQKRVEPNFSKMLMAIRDGDTDTALVKFIESVDKRLFCTFDELGLICLLDPSSLFSTPLNISALPFLISSHGGKSTHKPILTQLLESGIYEDIAIQILPFVEEDICEGDVFKAITSGASHEMVRALVAQMKPEMASECVILGHKIFNNNSSDDVMLESLKALKTIPTALLSLLAEEKHGEVLLDLVDARDDIVVTGYHFWFKISKLRNGKSIAKCLLKTQENQLGAMMILDPESVHDLLSSHDLFPAAFKMAPLVISTFLGTGKHHGRLLRFLAGKTFTNTEAFEVAAMMGANDVVLHKLFHTSLCTQAQIHKGIIKLIGLPAVSNYLRTWIHQLSPQWIFKTLQSVIDSQDQKKTAMLVEIICSTSWNVNISIKLLEMVYNVPGCRAPVLESIEAMMKDAKKDIMEKTDMVSAVMSHALSFVQGIVQGRATLGPLNDLRTLLINVFGTENIMDCCTEKHLTTTITCEARQFLPAYLFQFLSADQFKSMAKKTWKHSLVNGIKFCMDFDIPPYEIIFLLHALKEKQFLEVVLHAVNSEKEAYIEYFSENTKIIKKMKILTEYVIRSPIFSIPTFIRLDMAFKFAGQDSRSLLHVCLARSIPEPLIRHIISKYHFQKRLSGHVVYDAALNGVYSDDLIAVLISHCAFEQFAGKLVRKLEEGGIERGEELMTLLKKMASDSSRLPTRLSPKHF